MYLLLSADKTVFIGRLLRKHLHAIYCNISRLEKDYLQIKKSDDLPIDSLLKTLIEGTR